ncbi:hypothetical protein ASC90_23845 [Rhizobium sp. Root1220]|nr:hypothetical protein ASC90_23845 [Rhizobium sp. Root1220]
MLAWHFVARSEKPEKSLRSPSLSRPVDTSAIKGKPGARQQVPQIATGALGIQHLPPSPPGRNVLLASLNHPAGEPMSLPTV